MAMVETPVQTECLISGLLSYVLHISRLMDIAPFESKRVRDGWLIHSSSILQFYSKALVLIFVTFTLIALTADLTIDVRTSIRTENKANRILWIADVAITTIVILTAAYTGSNRMRYMIDYMAKLNQINVELYRLHKTSSSCEILYWMIVLFSLIFSCITTFLDYYFFILSVLDINGKVLTSSFYLFYHILCIQLQLLVILFAVNAMSIVPALSHVNRCLKGLLLESNNNSTTTTTLANVYSKINKSSGRMTLFNRLSSYDNNVIQVLPAYGHVKKHSLGLPQVLDIYCSLCDIIRNLAESNGLILAMLLLSFLIHLIITPYYLINEIFHSAHQSHHGGLTLQCASFICHFTKLAMVVEPCHQTYIQMELTKKLINQMKRSTPADNTNLISELKYFSQHLNMNKVTYSPMQLFTLNRTLILAMMGNITTYLVVAIQT